MAFIIMCASDDPAGSPGLPLHASEVLCRIRLSKDSLCHGGFRTID